MLNIKKLNTNASFNKIQTRCFYKLKITGLENTVKISLKTQKILPTSKKRVRGRGKIRSADPLSFEQDKYCKDLELQ